jgi:hypothetical protein
VEAELRIPLGEQPVEAGLELDAEVVHALRQPLANHLRDGPGAGAVLEHELAWREVEPPTSARAR